MKITQSTLKELCKIAEKAAITAGRHIESRFDQTYETRSKVGGNTLASQVVTEVDIRAQAIILEHLADSIKTFDLGWLGEEAPDDSSRLNKDYFWCVDPIDGTLPFTEHRTGYAVSVALISQDGDPLIGVAHIPDLGLTYSAVKGDGVQLNEQKFVYPQETKYEKLDFYMDRSMLSEPYYEFVLNELDDFAKTQHGINIHCHSSFGGVRNAIGVMNSANGCYFKFTKPQKGCGSLWDYGATRLLLEESGLHVSNISGTVLHLNKPDTTFLNNQGILYATNKSLAKYIMNLGERVQNKFDNNTKTVSIGN